MNEGLGKPKTGKEADIFDRLHLGIFDETDAGRFLGSNMLRATFASDYVQRIDFTRGEVLRAVLHAVDVMKDPSSSVVTRAKAQLLLDTATLSQKQVPTGTLGEFLRGIQAHSDDPSLPSTSI